MSRVRKRTVGALSFLLVAMLSNHLPMSAAGSAVQASVEDALIAKAYGQMKREEFVPAIRTLVSALKLDQDSLTARRYLAYALLRAGEPENALTQLILITRLAIPNAFDWYTFGEVYLAAGSYKQAEEAFKDALEKNPHMDGARGGLIKTFAQTGQYDKAMELIRQGYSQSRFPESKDYYRRLMSYVYELRRSPQASAVIVAASGASGAAQTAVRPKFDNRPLYFDPRLLENMGN